MPYLFVARTHGAVRTPKFSSDNASDKRQFCRLSLALSLPVRSHLSLADCDGAYDYVGTKTMTKKQLQLKKSR